MTSDKNKVFRLEGKVQHYEWGGTSFLPRLLGMANPDNRHFAEYWMGAHAQASSQILTNDEDKVKLDEYIRRFPEQTLGPTVASRFGRLPYLFKILDVHDMLSIQVHPSKKNAELAFADENSRGVSLTAAERNYRDDNHKPEIMLALGEFWLLHGFKPKETMYRILQEVPELNFLSSVFARGGYETLYHTVMQMPQAEVNRVLDPLQQRIVPAYRNGQLSRSQADFWAARAAETFNRPGYIDRGIFSIYLFNLMQLEAGEAVFQDAGVPHAYLEGHNVELMANSDNVLRGGLTNKHINVPELMKHVQFRETLPHVIRAKQIAPELDVFPTAAPDFELGRIHLPKDKQIPISSTSAEIYFVFRGAVEVADQNKEGFHRKTGEAWISFYGAGYWISAQEEAVIYRAAVTV
ncbi:MAG TPA: mannose-6-phosphate isomerase, class I [Puia sp.]|nr:mannose-6-phosphate isomerase, class I [Puia sp.]